MLVYDDDVFRRMRKPLLHFNSNEEDRIETGRLAPVRFITCRERVVHHVVVLVRRELLAVAEVIDHVCTRVLRVQVVSDMFDYFKLLLDLVIINHEEWRSHYDPRGQLKESSDLRDQILSTERLV
jgi:hypothetical protein